MGLTPTSRRDPAPQRVTPERLSSAPAPPAMLCPLRRDGNAMLVEALVGGTVRTRLLLDTGAEFTVLSTAAARRLALEPGSAAVIPLRSASGVFFAPMIKVQSITVGEATAYDVEVIVHDATPGLDGLLGMSFLDNFLVTISTSDERLILTPSQTALTPNSMVVIPRTGGAGSSASIGPRSRASKGISVVAMRQKWSGPCAIFVRNWRRSSARHPRPVCPAAGVIEGRGSCMRCSGIPQSLDTSEAFRIYIPSCATLTTYMI